MTVPWLLWAVVVSFALAMASPPARAEGTIKNGLTSRSLRRNALTTNVAALQSLRSHPLTRTQDGDLFADDPYVLAQLQDPRAQAVMEEIVKCALGPETTVTFREKLPGNAPHTWRGELGLCRAGPNDDPQSPSWTDRPNEPCQQLVTACLLARTNGLHASVPIALRGQPSNRFPPRDPISTATMFREGRPGDDPSEGTSIGSFGGPACLKDHECGWAPAFVGACSEGTVELAIKDPAVCATTPVRVCAGLNGCFRGGSGYDLPYEPGAPDDPMNHHYWQWWKEVPGACSNSRISFPCPTQFGGYYSVMTRPAHGGTGQSGSLGQGVTITSTPHSPALIKAGGVGTYPATEHQVFTFLEGAFYGNMFDPAQLSLNCVMSSNGMTRTCTPTPLGTGTPQSCDIAEDARSFRSGPSIAGVGSGSGAGGGCVEPETIPYRDAYACYSLAQQQDSQGTGDDDESASYFNARICDEPGAECFFHKPTRCHFTTPELNEKRGAHCAWNGESYENCKDPEAKKAYLPITIYLSDACDLIKQGELCGKIQASLRAHRRPAIITERCGRCSLEGGGSLAPIGLALLALLRRRRTASNAGRMR